MLLTIRLRCLATKKHGALDYRYENEASSSLPGSHALNFLSTPLATAGHEDPLSGAKSRQLPDPFCSLSPLSPTSYNQVSWGREVGREPGFLQC